MTKKSEINQYDFIDALRGIAILLVIATHIAPIAPPSGDILRRIAQSGAYGVQLFYIVSALTLFLSTNQRSHTEKNRSKISLFVDSLGSFHYFIFLF